MSTARDRVVIFFCQAISTSAISIRAITVRAIPIWPRTVLPTFEQVWFFFHRRLRDKRNKRGWMVPAAILRARPLLPGSDISGARTAMTNTA